MLESSTNLSGVTPVNGGTAASAVSTLNPITLIPLGSVACTVTLSFTSTREETVCDTVGGVTSFPGVCTVTVTGFVNFERPAASTARSEERRVGKEGRSVGSLARLKHRLNE